MLEPLIHVRSHHAVTGLSGVDLVAIKQKHQGITDLVIDEAEAVKPITGAGSGTGQELKQGPLAEVIARLNEFFGDEVFTVGQQETWLEGLVRTLLAGAQLREQAEANSKNQFLASPSLRTKVLLAVMSNQQAQAKMADITHAGGRPERVPVELTGELIHHLVREPARAPRYRPDDAWAKSDCHCPSTLMVPKWHHAADEPARRSR